MLRVLLTWVIAAFLALPSTALASVAVLCGAEGQVKPRCCCNHAKTERAEIPCKIERDARCCEPLRSEKPSTQAGSGLELARTLAPTLVATELNLGALRPAPRPAPVEAHRPVPIPAPAFLQHCALLI